MSDDRPGAVGAIGAIGVIGIGHMGLPIALRLRERGHAVCVRDIRAEREALAEGCSVLPAPAELARRCAVVIVVVVDAAQTEAVLFGDDGVAQGAAPGAAVLLCPTIAPADTERFAARLAERGIAGIDAPMSGGPERARLGTMSLMVACPDEAFERHRALLAEIADPVLRVGTRAGDGARTKLVNNLLAAINLAGAAEAMALAERLGLNAATTLAVIERSSGQSWIGMDRMRRAVAGRPEVHAHVGLLAKDSRLALAEAARVGFAAPLGAEAAARFAHAIGLGLADADDSTLLALARETGPSPGQD